MDWKKVDEIIREYLGTRYHLVGVKLRKNSIQREHPLKPEKPMAFCQMVRIASQTGRSFLYDKTDVILATLNSKQMMDLTAILLVESRNPLHVEFKSEAACGDFFVKPYLEKKPNLSFLCSGARLFADFRESDLIFGVPPQLFVQASETIERIEKTGGALCGCRTSDLPTWVVDEFEKIGFSKGIDYFFGKIGGHNVRIYLNKDFQGKPRFLTVHMPVKMSSDAEAENSVKAFKPILSRPYHARQRGNWLDLFMTITLDELGADLDVSESIMLALEEITDNMIQFLRKAKVEA